MECACTGGGWTTSGFASLFLIASAENGFHFSVGGLSRLMFFLFSIAEVGLCHIFMRGKVQALAIFELLHKVNKKYSSKNI